MGWVDFDVVSSADAVGVCWRVAEGVGRTVCDNVLARDLVFEGGADAVG